MTLARTPMRTCIACRRTRPQAELVRYRRRPDGEVVPAIGSARRHPTTWGRGAYVCPSHSCLTTATRRRAFARAFAGKGAPRPVVRSPEPGVLWTATLAAVGAEIQVHERTSGPQEDRIGGRRWQALVGLRDRLHQPEGSD